jgi:hypothetical protein
MAHEISHPLGFDAQAERDIMRAALSRAIY